MSHAILPHADPLYPARLRALALPPPAITIEGGPLQASCVVAIVGTRDSTPEADAFTSQLAAAVVRAGAVVVSGGALGIDAAAHRGALAAGGRTWGVAPVGRGECFPPENAALFDEIARGPGAMIWPFEERCPASTASFFFRNRVLVALSDVVVVVQAGAPSGALNAASCARQLERPLWVVPGPPWDRRFVGCRQMIEGGARVLTSGPGFLRALGLVDPEARDARGRSRKTRSTWTSPLDPLLPPPPPTSSSPPAALVDPAALALWRACSHEPRHADEIANRARVCASAALTGLLTLALENVLVEGPEGFYRRGNER